uniref:Uncharacterized protein n=1 Tax=Rhizophora mucronata TaxID=61149 RepID=A0A2P2JQS5_RHIMU
MFSLKVGFLSHFKWSWLEETFRNDFQFQSARFIQELLFSSSSI